MSTANQNLESWKDYSGQKEKSEEEFSNIKLPVANDLMGITKKMRARTHGA